MPALRTAMPMAIISLAIVALPGAQIARANDVEKFFAGKTITFITSTGVAGPYDTTARAMSRHMPRHIPGNPVMVVKNMPGGGHVLATNFMYNNAPRDGTHIATVNGTIPTHQVIDGTGVRFDARHFNWLGSTASPNLITVTWSSSKTKTIQDAMKNEVVAGATGAGSMAALYPTILNNVLGTKFKIVMGYKSAGAIDLALEAGEVESRSGNSYDSLRSDHPDWLRNNKVNILVQVGARRAKEMPDVPLMHELGRTEEERNILMLLSSAVTVGRPVFLPQDVPADRVSAMRKAFDATMKDPAFLEETKKLGLEIDPTNWEELTKAVNDTINQPPEVIAKARAAIQLP